jgi:GNAT superfamily N-acetyltransferase
MNWTPRLAREKDIPALEELIPSSVRILQAPYYSSAQMEAAIGPVFGVDRQLIRDGTYFAVDHEDRIVGCGGWSKRKTLYGGDRDRIGEDEELDPKHDAARIRAFFVHPTWARRGIGRAILMTCEGAALAAGFQRAELVATLAGEPLYAAFGYHVADRYEAPMAGGLSLSVVRMGKALDIGSAGKVAG